MASTIDKAIAIVGVGAILPDAPNVPSFWENVKSGRYSISEVDPQRWDPALYYDADPAAPDKTYSKIGGWVREKAWDPMHWHLPIPPRVSDAMDEAQRWAIACTREALEDYGYPSRPLDTDRTAVILGNAMAGEKHYLTAVRLFAPEYERDLSEVVGFAGLPPKLREEIKRELHKLIGKRFPEITEDTMPGELANCIAGRIANLYNLHGPNYVVDAACASAMAAINAAAEGLVNRDFDFAITGGIDRNMGPSTFIKFCKIGALSATGTRPYAQGADGFVMGEGAAVLLLKRLADAEHDEDKVYAVIRGIAGSSDGKGKGITAPNPVGQKICIANAWKNAGVSPDDSTLVEGHGTSTRVGDVVEVECLSEVFREFNLPAHSVALGSVKSNLGHLKGAAGAAGILKSALALHDGILPPSVHCDHLNPDIDFARSPLYVNPELKDWKVPPDKIRRAGVSAFGFGGTNFHAVLEEYVPGRTNGDGKRSISVELPAAMSRQQQLPKAPMRGAMVMGADSERELATRLRLFVEGLQRDLKLVSSPSTPDEKDLKGRERIAIDYSDPTDLIAKATRAINAFASSQPAMWKALRSQGIFRGQGLAPKIAFLYPGQGSQYVNMLRQLWEREPIVAQTFAEADQVLKPLLGKPLTEFIFVDPTRPELMAKGEESLRQTEITQPAVLTADIALTRLLAFYGIEPSMAMGHSLGEYAALVAAGALPFEDALEAVSARGREMTRVSVADNGLMAAIGGPIEQIEDILRTIDGYVVIANINSNHQAVIGGATKAVEQAVARFESAGFNVTPLAVSHAFHTSIVAPASEPLRKVLQRLHLTTPKIPTISNVTGEFYPSTSDSVSPVLDLLSRQVASPVQFVKGLHTLYEAGARVFVEVGPKKALQGLAEDVVNSADSLALFTNHPKFTDEVAFNQALCGIFASGIGQGTKTGREFNNEAFLPKAYAEIPAGTLNTRSGNQNGDMQKERFMSGNGYYELGRKVVELVEQTWSGNHEAPANNERVPVVITGAALGLPGTEHVFDDNNVVRILAGQQFISAVPTELRRAMVDKRITRLVKSDNGGPTFETINSLDEVIKLAGRAGTLDLEHEFGVSAERVAAFDRTTSLAIGAGIDALRDAGIPLVMRYKNTSKGTRLPDGWVLPESMRDDTSVIFGSAFPGYDAFATQISRFHKDRARRDELKRLETYVAKADSTELAKALKGRIAELREAIEKDPYTLDRRFLLLALPMGHSQFAEFIGARGPNTQINAACATTTQAVSLAEDWINAGRCRRVIIITADDVTSDQLMEWFGAGFLASGAAATDERVEDAAIPFDRRRHGMIVGMGAAALIVESAEAARERGIKPICEVLGSSSANSAFHATRLNLEHISRVMESLVATAEKRFGISRKEIAPRCVFVSHETYTPARGGSASAEINALRSVFGEAADQIVIANTKGFTGHAMAAGIEDVVAVKALETGCVPPVANHKEVDPELGELNLSKGGAYPVEYALRMGAGFGSQISMSLLRWVKTKDNQRQPATSLGYTYRIADNKIWTEWLQRISGQPIQKLEIANRTLRVPSGNAEVQSVGRLAEIVSTAKAEPDFSTTSPQQSPVAQQVVNATPVPSADIKEQILKLVSEKTGYPVDMLDVDLDLEADLGVDTVKQAEVFASVRAMYGIERDDTIRLRDFPTLAHVIRFVEERQCKDAMPQPTESKTDISTSATPTKSEMPSAPSPVAASTLDDVREQVLALVVEKTGYPKEMLDLDLDLEADLGIDTVKQAELFAAIRQIYGIERDPNLKLRDFPTLTHVIGFVQSKRKDLVAPSVSPEIPAEISGETQPSSENLPETISVKAEDAVVSLADDEIRDKLLSVVAEKTGYPKEMLDIDLDLEADLGIDTVKQAEMFATVRQLFSIERDPNLKLRDFPTLQHIIRFVQERTKDHKSETPAPVALEQPTAPPVGERPTLVTPPSEPVTEHEIVSRVLEIASAKTGYPTEMLDLNLDLESDLGIDTVKQAELFASVREAYNIPRFENLKLRDFPTLGHVIDFARAKRTRVAHPHRDRSANTAHQEAAVKELTTPPARTVASFAAADRVPRRVPVPCLRPPLDICKKTGVTFGPGSRVVMMPDKGVVAESLEKLLLDLGVVVLRLNREDDSNQIKAKLDKWLAEAPIQGVYWLASLDQHLAISEMDSSAWHDEIRLRVKSLFESMRVLYDAVLTNNNFLVVGTRLGGQHGYDEAGATSPMGGATVGFAKSFKRERLSSTVKAVDFELSAPASTVAQQLFEETLRGPGAVEIGYKSGLRWTAQLQEQSAKDGCPGLPLNENTVFLVTGAAGSIVSAITADLATASGGTFYLLDLVPQPDANNPDLQRFVTDKDGLKRDIFTRLQAGGKRATPAMVEKELAGIERARAALDAIRAVTNSGGIAHYFSVDLRDSDAVEKVFEQIRKLSGKIDVLLHAAGLERSHLLPDKNTAEFDLVFDVKATGLFNLLHSIGSMPLGAVVAFSSIAGRFGNAGQTDYSAANDLLCKIMSSMRRTHPNTRGIAIDWTAWSGIGMATRGSIPKMMEAAGIDMLPPEAGIPVVRRELTSGGFKGELLIGQRLGILESEWDETGGIESIEVDAGPMIGNVVAMPTNGTLKVEATLDPANQPFLRDHQIEGIPVLPGVMGLEAFAEAASLVLPGYQVQALEDVEFVAPFKFYRSAPRTITLNASFNANANGILAQCTLLGNRKLVNTPEPTTTTHFTGRVHLAKAKGPQGISIGGVGLSAVEPVIEAKDIYQVYFHGPAYQVLESAWRDQDRMIGKLKNSLPANHSPADKPIIIAPRLIELCFQTAGLWEITAEGRMGLPRHIDRVVFLEAPLSESEPMWAIVTPDERKGCFRADVVGANGKVYLQIFGYQTVPFMTSVDSSPLKWLQAVAA